MAANYKAKTRAVETPQKRCVGAVTKGSALKLVH